MFGMMKSKKSVAKENGQVNKKDASAVKKSGTEVASPKATTGKGVVSKLPPTATRSAPAITPQQKAAMMKKGGCVKKYAKGGGVEVRGKTKGKMI